MSNEGYDITPSFFTDEKYFSRYLGCTSYYRSLQRVIDVVIKMSKPKTVIELGSALGTTSLHLAKKYPDIQFNGVDNRQSVVHKSSIESLKQQNTHFAAVDMEQLVQSTLLREYDLIFMLYSFHHIEDPISRKVRFLENCYKYMKVGGRLCICETFLPEGYEIGKDSESVQKLYEMRGVEGYASTLWTILDMMDSKNESYFRFAKEMAHVSKDGEIMIGRMVRERDNEYYVHRSWLCDRALETGFHIIFSEPINAIGEGVVLLEKTAYQSQ